MISGTLFDATTIGATSLPERNSEWIMVLVRCGVSAANSATDMPKAKPTDASLFGDNRS